MRVCKCVLCDTKDKKEKMTRLDLEAKQGRRYFFEENPYFFIFKIILNEFLTFQKIKVKGWKRKLLKKEEFFRKY